MPPISITPDVSAGPGGGLVPMVPVRALDTRTGAPVPAGSTVVVDLGAALSPAAIAAALNVTATRRARGGLSHGVRL